MTCVWQSSGSCLYRTSLALQGDCHVIPLLISCERIHCNNLSCRSTNHRLSLTNMISWQHCAGLHASLWQMSLTGSQCWMRLCQLGKHSQPGACFRVHTLHAQSLGLHPVFASNEEVGPQVFQVLCEFQSPTRPDWATEWQQPLVRFLLANPRSACKDLLELITGWSGYTLPHSKYFANVMSIGASQMHSDGDTAHV